MNYGECVVENCGGLHVPGTEAITDLSLIDAIYRATLHAVRIEVDDRKVLRSASLGKAERSRIDRLIRDVC